MEMGYKATQGKPSCKRRKKRENCRLAKINKKYKGRRIKIERYQSTDESWFWLGKKKKVTSVEGGR